MYSIEYLLKHSNLPGPRGNLELLYAFSKEADNEIIQNCLNYIKNYINNTPAEFVGMCGILGYAQRNKGNVKKVINFIQKYASHDSWRIREAVAMSIQELSANRIENVLENIRPWVDGNFFEQRAVVAGLCEPKLLKDIDINTKILEILEAITHHINHENKLTTQEESLRKALGYGWSVVIASSPENGKKFFEKLFSLPGKHIKWILKENLKKNRLLKMDSEWIAKCNRRLTIEEWK